MKTTKILTILVAATLPFFAACVSKAERQCIVAEQAEQARLAKEAERKRLAEEARLAKERAKRERLAAIKANMLAEKTGIRSCLQSEIFPAEEKLSEDEQSRGWTLLTDFGEEQMPQLTERCTAARRNFLEAKANLAELTAALKAEDPSFDSNAASDKRSANRRSRDEAKPQANPVFEAAKNRWLDLARNIGGCATSSRTIIPRSRSARSRRTSSPLRTKPSRTF